MAFKRPESVLVVLYDERHRLLLLQREDDADFWQSVTGTVEENELPEQTAIREVAEETGIILQPSLLTDCRHINRYQIRERWLYRYPPGTCYNTEHVFCAQVSSKFPVKLTEHLAFEWLSKPAALARLWSPSNRLAVEAFVPRPRT
ncbi:dihydroneopterin triphosphate diphosphatase [Aestuariibacter sp. A3R04]|uniref:dihydroneopterin triphosphate diphosphatase n=1 Tax=Aestuariibacter sp. A3R04 TaxID=2841571 RepID=UPI001C0A5889|nr:dihydroneopterin triphosphate diphosphatase [Aestuariibacter sp. A3R04]MBU3022445.1 dihydroneopterin triphosphate diphosphatase [Aestuariibacter sp. A3R04]